VPLIIPIYREIGYVAAVGVVGDGSDQPYEAVFIPGREQLVGVIDHSPDTFQIPDRPSKARFGKKPGHGFGTDRPT
jgi:hypothetical protein